MTTLSNIEALYTCVQTRPRPEDVAEVVLDVLQQIERPWPRGVDRGSLRSTVEHAAQRSLRRLSYAYSSMAQDFARPVGMDDSVRVASELFRVERLSPTECLDSEAVEQFVRSVSVQICKVYGESDFKAHRLNREGRAAKGLAAVGHRAYNKRFRLLARMEARLQKLVWEQRKYALTRAGKSAFATQISKDDLLADPLTACFVAYQSARMSMRSTFTNGPQERAFDDVAGALFKACLKSPTTRWDVIACVLPDQEVLAHLTDEQKGVVLGRAWNLLVEAADFLATCTSRSAFDLKNMIVQRGNDSSTWNQAAGGWNKTREQWLNVLHALRADSFLDGLCPGKVLRLMAADVVGWHRWSKGSIDDALHPDTKVWRDLPLPWEVVRGEKACPRRLVQSVCEHHRVDSKSWTGVREGRQPVPFKPTPELVHGVAVSSPFLAKALRKAGVFSGKDPLGDVPEFVVDRDPSGAARSIWEVDTE